MHRSLFKARGEVNARSDRSAYFCPEALSGAKLHE